MDAVEQGHKDIVRMLLDAGADTSTADSVSSCLCVYVYVCVCVSLRFVCLSRHIEWLDCLDTCCPQ
jgi:hypothetical protein